MKPKFSIFLIILLTIVILITVSCEKENFPQEYQGIYGNWTIRGISGGFSGGGYKPDFDILVINRDMTYELLRNDTLLSYGNIDINITDANVLSIQFNPGRKSVQKTNNLFYGIKYVGLNNDSLILDEGCCDMYSYFFVRSEVFNDERYAQANKELDYVKVEKYEIGIDKKFTSIYFINDNLGFITCFDGSILKTENGGKNWKITLTNDNLPLNAIAFVNELTGYAVGGQNYCNGTGCTVPGYIMLKTTDCGETWERVSLPYNQHVLCKIVFLDQNTGLALGSGIMLRTEDEGLNWNPISIQNLRYVYDICILNESVCYLSCIDGKLYKTEDKGESWETIDLNTDYQLYSVMFLNETIGYVGKWNVLDKTTDSGLTWNTVDNAPNEVKKIFFYSENEGVVFGTKTYSSSIWDVWNSSFNVLLDGKWFGDSRIGYSQFIFCLNPNKFFTVSNNEVNVITVDLGHD